MEYSVNGMEPAAKETSEGERCFDLVVDDLPRRAKPERSVERRRRPRTLHPAGEQRRVPFGTEPVHQLAEDLGTDPTLLVQPVDHHDVAETLAEVSTHAPQNDIVELAGPYPEDLVDMARRTLAARGEQLRLRPTWDGLFDLSMSGTVLLPGPDARIGSISFDDWLAAGAR